MSFRLVILLLFSVSAQGKENWPVFYNSEKGPEHLSISRRAHIMAVYTNDFPSWNYDLLTPRAKINSTEIKELGKVKGLRVIEARFSLTATYYTHMLMILEEVTPGQFLPVYVQVYNHGIRAPSESVVAEDQKGLIILTGMDYEGTGHFHDHYKITISANHDPVIVGSNY